MCLLQIIKFFKSNQRSHANTPTRSFSLKSKSSTEKMSSTNNNQLSDPRLVITAHTPEGSSVFTSDETVTPFKPFGPNGSSFCTFHSAPSVPVSNTAALPDLTKVLPRCPPTGVNFGISEFPPNARSPMHRTTSVDYAYVISGEIVLSLDSGEKKTIRAGEFVLQRGVNHEWINPSSEVPCRMIFVMVGAEKIVLGDGKVLEETVFGGKK
jgi:quercetin dioxygenase-like cupin family protein